jgi:moderate conductance mechanosensitive channel
MAQNPTPANPSNPSNPLNAVGDAARSVGTGYVRRLAQRLGATDFQAQTAEFLLVGPLRILFIVLSAWALGRFGGRFLRRAVAEFRRRAPIRNRSLRSEQRAQTIGDALASGWRVVVVIIAALLVLGEFGVNLGPLLAGAGIAGLAIAFGAQSLIKDYLSGLFILLEDQFGIGDVVTIGTASGAVEDISLRITRLRAADGTVWFIPNGEIRQVGNQSMEWSRAIVDVTISYDNDVNVVMAALAEEISTLRNDPIIGSAILETPEVQGVQAMSAEGVTIRLVAKTAPRQQWKVARELRVRVTDRMRKDNVRGPGRTVLVSSGTIEGPPSAAGSTLPGVQSAVFDEPPPVEHA